MICYKYEFCKKICCISYNFANYSFCFKLIKYTKFIKIYILLNINLFI